MKGFAVKTLAYEGAPAHLHSEGLEMLRAKLSINLIDNAAKPSILLFLTGGSEAEAIKHLDRDHFQLLVSSGRSNAYASAMEVKAYSHQNHFQNSLFNLDDPGDIEDLGLALDVLAALENLKGKRLGIIGNESGWLVASGVEDTVLKAKLGIELVRIPWPVAGDHEIAGPDKDFIKKFKAGKQFNIEDASRVHSLLKKVIADHHLDAVTVECFPMVQEKGVTACLSLSFLNDLGIPAGCEGDISSITGMMVARELFGEIPWMANLAGVKGNKLLLAHCTAPVNMLSGYNVFTHYETGKGTAVQGMFNWQGVTVFRFSNKLDRLFAAYGKAVNGVYEENACRTQLWVELPENDIRELKTNPLGNHHLVLPGDRRTLIRILENVIRGYLA